MKAFLYNTFSKDVNKRTYSNSRCRIDFISREALWNRKTLDINAIEDFQKNFVLIAVDSTLQSYVLYLEYPLNSDPCEEEGDIAAKIMFKFDARHILLVKVDCDFKASVLVNNDLSSRNYPGGATERTIFKCCDSRCNRYFPRKLAFPLCELDDHMCCVDHIVKMSSPDKIDLYWDQNMDVKAAIMQQYTLSREAEIGEDLRCRVAIASNFLEPDTTDERMIKMMERFAEKPEMLCIGCKEKKTNTNVVLRDQLSTVLQNLRLDSIFEEFKPVIKPLPPMPRSDQGQGGGDPYFGTQQQGAYHPTGTSTVHHFPGVAMGNTHITNSNFANDSYYNDFGGVPAAGNHHTINSYNQILPDYYNQPSAGGESSFNGSSYIEGQYSNLHPPPSSNLNNCYGHGLSSQHELNQRTLTSGNPSPDWFTSHQNYNNQNQNQQNNNRGINPYTIYSNDDEYTDVHVGCPEFNIKPNSQDSSILIEKGNSFEVIEIKFKAVIERFTHISIQDFDIYCRIGPTENWKKLIIDNDYYNYMNDNHNHGESKEGDIVFDFFRDGLAHISNRRDISDLFMTIHQIKSGQEFSLRRATLANVEPRHSLTAAALKDRYNGFVYDTLRDLQSPSAASPVAFNGFRKIRGDGNCYYRSVIFGLLEDIIALRDFRRLKVLRDQLAEAKAVQGLDELLIVKPGYSIEPNENTVQPPVYARFAPELDWLLDKMDATIDSFMGINFRLPKSTSKCTPWASKEDFENEIICSERLDHILIAVCRVLESNWALVNQNRDFDGLTFRDAVQTEDILDYCKEVTMRWCKPAEGVTVEKGALSEILHCDIRIVLRPRDQVSRFMDDNNQTYIGEDRIGSVACLLRPGHYDLLYMSEDYRSHAGESIPSSLSSRQAEVDEVIELFTLANLYNLSDVANLLRFALCNDIEFSYEILLQEVEKAPILISIDTSPIQISGDSHLTFNTTPGADISQVSISKEVPTSSVSKSQKSLSENVDDGKYGPKGRFGFRQMIRRKLDIPVKRESEVQDKAADDVPAGTKNDARPYSPSSPSSPTISTIKAPAAATLSSSSSSESLSMSMSLASQDTTPGAPRLTSASMIEGTSHREALLRKTDQGFGFTVYLHEDGQISVCYFKPFMDVVGYNNGRPQEMDYLTYINDKNIYGLKLDEVKSLLREVPINTLVKLSFIIYEMTKRSSNDKSSSSTSASGSSTTSTTASSIISTKPSIPKPSSTSTSNATTAPIAVTHVSPSHHGPYMAPTPAAVNTGLGVAAQITSSPGFNNSTSFNTGVVATKTFVANVAELRKHEIYGWCISVKEAFAVCCPTIVLRNDNIDIVSGVIEVGDIILEINDIKIDQAGVASAILQSLPARSVAKLVLMKPLVKKGI